MLKERERRQGHRLSSDPEQGGQSLTEFALTMPLLIALLVAVMALAWVGFSYVSITSAARVGTRHMISLNPPDEPEDSVRFATADEEITYIVTSAMPMLNWRQAEVLIAPQPATDRVFGTDVSIQIIYHMDSPEIRIPFVVREGSFLLLPPITLQATSQMRIY